MTFVKSIFGGKKGQRGNTTNVIASEPGRARQSKAAFTLAEMLITLVIIGVVAALTIPNLLQKYQEQATVKKVQKFYSNLSNAYKLAMKENGPASDWGFTDNTKENSQKIYEILFKPYFKIARDCGNYNTGNCIASTDYKNLNGSSSGTYGGYGSYYKLVLNDGAAIFWRSTTDESTFGIGILYDTNGVKGPNMWGRDLFSFGINGEKVYATGSPISGTSSFNLYCNPNSNRSYNGPICTAWVVYKGNMDYLHCDDLSWTGKDKCK